MPPGQCSGLLKQLLLAVLCCDLQARNTSMLAQCFYHLEDFGSLTKLVEVLTEGQPMLADIGKKLQSVGLCTEAVAAFTKVSPGACCTEGQGSPLEFTAYQSVHRRQYSLEWYALYICGWAPEGHGLWHALAPPKD